MFRSPFLNGSFSFIFFVSIAFSVSVSAQAQRAHAQLANPASNVEAKANSEPDHRSHALIVDEAELPTSFILGRAPLANLGYSQSVIKPDQSVVFAVQDRLYFDRPEGFVLLSNWGDTDKRHAVDFVPLQQIERSTEVLDFLATLAQEKLTLIKIYNLRNDEYNRLAAMAFGILGTESKFFSNLRYHIKEGCPFCAPVARVMLRRPDQDWTPIEKKSKKPASSGSLADSVDGFLTDYKHEDSHKSHGPTQIKKIPRDIAAAYGIKLVNLDDEAMAPRYAAIATLGFLAEGLRWAKKLPSKVSERKANMQGDGIYDYIPYYYEGGKRMQHALEGVATPDKIPYIVELKSYMSDLLILEGKEI